MTLAEFVKMTKGKTEIALSPLEWDEIKSACVETGALYAAPLDAAAAAPDVVGEVNGVLVRVKPDALAAWQKARKDDAKAELKRRADKAKAEEDAEAAAAAAKEAAAERADIERRLLDLQRAALAGAEAAAAKKDA